jgi:hypothetical protein
MDKSSSFVIQDQLRTIARLLHEVHPLSAETQRLLGALLAELSDALGDETIAPDRLAHFTATTARLVEAVHREERHHVAGLRDRLAHAAAEVETNHPILAGLARQLIDALSSLGI